MFSLLRTNRHAAFTLVELLVVIGIIAVLLAILFPALNAARHRANAIKCMANLHAIGQALTLYTQQTGYYPGYAANPGSPSAYNPVVAWAPRLRALLSNDSRLFYCPARTERREWTDHPLNAFLRATAKETGLGYSIGEFMPNPDFTPASYGYNGIGADLAPTGLGDGEAVKASVVRIASAMVAIADANDTENGDWLVYPESSTKATPGRVHFGGPNVLFCDGHVQWYPVEEVIGSAHDRAAWRRVEMMWNNSGVFAEP